MEFALVMTVLLMLLLGIISFGLQFGTRILAVQAASEGARAAVAGLSDAERLSLAATAVAATPRPLRRIGRGEDRQHHAVGVAHQRDRRDGDDRPRPVRRGAGLAADPGAVEPAERLGRGAGRWLLSAVRDILPELPAALAFAALAVTDARSRRLPRPIMGAFFLAGGAAAAWRGGPAGLAMGLAGAVLAAMPLVLLRRWLPRHWRLGGGDIRLAAALGLWLGAPAALLVLAAGAGLGASLGAIWAAVVGGGRRAPDIPLACACLAAFALWLVAGGALPVD